MRNAQVLEELGEAELDLLALQALELEDRLHVLLDRKAPKNGVFLRQVGDAHPGTPVDGEVREVPFVEMNAAGINRYQPDDHVEAGRFAGAVRTQQPDDLAARYFERDVLHHGPRLVALAQALRAQDAHFLASSEAAFGWITALTRPPGAPLPALTEKKSER